MNSVLPHSNDTTSLAAAQSMLPHAANLRRRVVEYIATRGAEGATDEQIQDALQMNPSTERPRRGEAWGYGMITDTCGEHRATKSGRAATVWHVTSRGIEALGMPAESWCVRWPA